MRKWGASLLTTATQLRPGGRKCWQPVILSGVLATVPTPYAGVVKTSVLWGLYERLARRLVNNSGQRWMCLVYVMAQLADLLLHQYVSDL